MYQREAEAAWRAVEVALGEQEWELTQLWTHMAHMETKYEGVLPSARAGTEEKAQGWDLARCPSYASPLRTSRNLGQQVG